MVLEIHTDTVPLRTTEEGVVLIGQTRVPLQTVVVAFHRGDSPEQIVHSYTALTLAEVYAVIAYYLRHREEVDEYIRQQEAAAAQLRQELESKHPEMFKLKARLLERKRQQGQ